MLEKEIRGELYNLKDETYKQFHTRICQTNNDIIGVKVPLIRNLVKEYSKKYSFEELYKLKPIYYEEIMFKGLLIGNSKLSIKEIKPLIKEFIPLINNWAICDTFCSSLKITKRNQKEMRKFILQYKQSTKEYELRFMIVMILDYFIEEEYLYDNFKIFDSIKSDYYYVNMALAWAISICLVKYYKETLNYLKKSKINSFVYEKALQKAIESYRINNEQKKELKNMKNKRRFIC